MKLKKVADEFPVIRMDKGIVLEASQDPYGAMYYTVYNEDFSESLLPQRAVCVP